MNPTSGICVPLLFVCIFAVGKTAPTVSESAAKAVALNKQCGANEADSQIVLSFQVPSSDSGKCLMLCFLKQLDMLDSNEKYDEGKSFLAFRNFWSFYSDDILKSVNSAAAEHAKGIDSKSGTCEYGYQIMKFINTDFIDKQLLTTTLKP